MLTVFQKPFMEYTSQDTEIKLVFYFYDIEKNFYSNSINITKKKLVYQKKKKKKGVHKLGQQNTMHICPRTVYNTVLESSLCGDIHIFLLNNDSSVHSAYRSPSSYLRAICILCLLKAFCFFFTTFGSGASV